MTGGEQAFLALAIGAAVIFIVVIAYVSNLTSD
jgi:hypothetical protein